MGRREIKQKEETRTFQDGFREEVNGKNGFGGHPSISVEARLGKWKICGQCFEEGVLLPKFAGWMCSVSHVLDLKSCYSCGINIKRL